jgi:cAMP-dependent protein kinase regulator
MPPSPPPPRDPQDPARQQWQSTVLALRGLVDALPHDLSARQRLAEALQRAGDPQASADEYHRVASQYVALGQALKAVATCRTALSVVPSHAPTLGLLANLVGQGPLTLTVPKSGPQDVSEDSSGSMELFLPGRRALVEDTLERPSQPVATAPLVSVQVDRATLADIPLFSGLSAADLERLFPLVSLRAMNAGDVLMTEGEPGDRMFILVQGMVQVVRGSGAAPQQVVAMLREGAVVGEMALLAHVPRLATVRAETDGVVMELSHADVTALVERHPTVARALETFVKQRVMLTVLLSSPLFRSLAQDTRAPLVARSTLRVAAAGDVLVQEGTHSGGLWLILRGRCAVAASTSGPLPELKEGDVFGEISLLRATPATATVTAVERSVLFLLPQDAFEALVRPNAEAQQALQALTEQRLGRLGVTLPPEWGT